MTPSTIKTRGIVLSHVKYGDNSIVVNIYTKLLGRQGFIVGNSNRNHRNIIPLLMPLSMVEIEAANRPHTTLQRIKNLHVARPLRTIPFNAARRSISMFITELLTKSLRDEGADESMFRFLSESIETLDSGIEGECNFHIYFMLGLAQRLGFSPDMSQSELPIFDLSEGIFTAQLPMHQYIIINDDLQLWRKLLYAENGDLPHIASSRTERARLVEMLQDYFKLHIPSFGSLNSCAILQQLFA